jgi:uncharacterized protein YjbI with pentapeptide repeats
MNELESKTAIDNQNNNCDVEDCYLQKHESNDRCILHCKKNDYSTDFESHTLAKFNIALIEFIVNQIDKLDHVINFNGDKNTLKVFLKGDENTQTSINAQKVKEVRLFFRDIYFPTRDERDPFDYLEVLKKLGTCHFQHCNFQATELGLENVKCFYENCEFNNRWYIQNSVMLKNVNGVLYQNCTFHKDVTSGSENNKTSQINSSLFFKCTFLRKLIFEYKQFTGLVFNCIDNQQTIKSLEFYHCRFDNIFDLRTAGKVKKIIIEHCTFNDFFSFNNNLDIGLLFISDTSFKKPVEICESSINILKTKDLIFESTAIFDGSSISIADFNYVIFKNISNFRGTNFEVGLDIENATFIVSPNFLNSHVSLKSSKRETFRTIKNSFDKVGNYIEANKFYALEMIKYQSELKGAKNKKKEKLVFFINNLASEFGQNYWRPIWLMLVFAFLYSLFVLSYENNILYNFSNSTNNKIDFVMTWINGVAKGFIPFQKVLKEGMEALSLLFGVILSGLTWQAIIAIKRHTRR